LVNFDWIVRHSYTHRHTHRTTTVTLRRMRRVLLN
jgi:hypothetical protein